MGEEGDKHLRIDLLGEYDENKLPENLKLPVGLNDRESAMVGLDNMVLFLYGISHELNPKMQERRRAEFIARMVNREIIVDRGAVLKNVGEMWQDGRLVVTYEMLGVNGSVPTAQEVQTHESEVVADALAAVQSNGHKENGKVGGKKVFDRGSYMKEFWAKRKAAKQEKQKKRK